jgi:hypothetical protein
MLCHGILNMHETKYGVDPNETILKTGMIHGFESVCDIHKVTGALVHFLHSCSGHVYSTI